MFACFDDLEDESLDYTSVADLPVWWSDDFLFSSNSEESPLHKLALSAVQAAHRRLDAFDEAALFPAQTSDRRRVARADRMCELESILLSHDKLKLRKNGPMESGSTCTVASPMERRASLILFLLLGLFATAGID